VISDSAESEQLARLIKFADRKKAKYGANIQNVKRDHFDGLICVLLFDEGIEIFKMNKNFIKKENISAWSDKHGRYDELGKSGQFNIKHDNIDSHERDSFFGFFTYEQLVPLYREIKI
jgi:hypothetical protein